MAFVGDQTSSRSSGVNLELKSLKSIGVAKYIYIYKKSTPAKNGCPPLNNIDCITAKAHKNPYSQVHSLLHCCSIVTDCSITVSKSKSQGGWSPPCPPGCYEVAAGEVNDN